MRANSKLPAYPTDTTTLYKGKGEKTAKKLENMILYITKIMKNHIKMNLMF